MKTSRLLSVAGAAILSSIPVQAASFHGLGFLAGGQSSWARAVSADGMVVVGQSYITADLNPKSEAFRWTEAGGMVGIGFLTGGEDSGAIAVSGDGTTVVGFSSMLAGDPPQVSGWFGFRWTQTGGMSPIGLWYARGVSGDGSVVVGDGSGQNDPTQAYRWTAAGPEALGVLHGGSSSWAMAVSSNGLSVVGTSFTDLTPSGEQAFLWTAEKGMSALVGLPGTTLSEGNGISADGSTVVGVCAGPEVTQAFRWTAAEGMTLLGTLPNGGNSTALAASGDGNIIIGFANTQYSEPFVWDITHGMRSLQGLLVEQHADLTGWSLDSALGISADGRTLVGSGYHNGATEAWIARVGDLTRPELSINLIAENLKISWPGIKIAGQLQVSPEPSGQWTNVDATPVITGNSQSVTLPVTDKAGFFRLIRLP